MPAPPPVVAMDLTGLSGIPLVLVAIAVIISILLVVNLLPKR